MDAWGGGGAESGLGVERVRVGGDDAEGLSSNLLVWKDGDGEIVPYHVRWCLVGAEPGGSVVLMSSCRFGYAVLNHECLMCKQR